MKWCGFFGGALLLRGVEVIYRSEKVAVGKSVSDRQVGEDGCQRTDKSPDN
jgi:hypothetical protein